MIDKVQWYIKPNSTGSYVEMLQPTDFEIEVEDLDANTYRSITTGNMIDSVVSKNWSKCKFKFENLTQQQATDLISKCSANPIYAKIENPIWSSGFLEAQFRCSKKTITKMMARDKRYSVSLNLVQKNKITGM